MAEIWLSLNAWAATFRAFLVKKVVAEGGGAEGGVDGGGGGEGGGGSGAASGGQGGGEGGGGEGGGEGGGQGGGDGGGGEGGGAGEHTPEPDQDESYNAGKAEIPDQAQKMSNLFALDKAVVP